MPEIIDIPLSATIRVTDARFDSLIRAATARGYKDPTRLPERRRYNHAAPPVDWTGHTYKATADLQIDYGHTGRNRATGGDTIRETRVNG